MGNSKHTVKFSIGKGTRPPLCNPTLSRGPGSYIINYGFGNPDVGFSPWQKKMSKKMDIINKTMESRMFPASPPPKKLSVAAIRGTDIPGGPPNTYGMPPGLGGGMGQASS